MQLDSGSDIDIVNEETWMYISKPKVSKFIKVAYGIMDRKLYFLGVFVCNVTFRDQMNTANLFVKMWVELFKLGNTLISVLCGNIVGSVEG